MVSYRPSFGGRREPGRAAGLKLASLINEIEEIKQSEVKERMVP
jgi:hypothetical protein